MKNPFQAKEWTIGTIVLLVWIPVSLVYVGITGWNQINRVVAAKAFAQGEQQGARKGQDAAITTIMERAQRCEPVTLFAGQGEERVEVTLVTEGECTPVEQPAPEAPAEEAPAVE